jgi:hypothetical protein
MLPQDNGSYHHRRHRNTEGRWVSRSYHVPHGLPALGYMRGKKTKVHRSSGSTADTGMVTQPDTSVSREVYHHRRQTDDVLC